MRSKILVLILTTALLTLNACSQRDENTDGNGPGNADGFGGRADPPDRPNSAAEPQQPAEPQQQPQQ